MDWARTKTIFILVFLLLNTFLFYSYLEQQIEYQESSASQTGDEESEQRLYGYAEEDLPDRIEQLHLEASYVDFESGGRSQKVEGNSNVNDVTYISNERLIGMSATLEDPVKISEDNRNEDLASFLSDYVWNAEDYEQGQMDEELNRQYYYQTFDDKQIYKPEASAQLELVFNDQNEIVGFRQSYFELDATPADGTIPAEDAIEALGNPSNGILQTNDTVSNVSVGYFNQVTPQGENVYLYTPMYIVEVNGETRYLVNARTQRVQSWEQVMENNDEEGVMVEPEVPENGSDLEEEAEEDGSDSGEEAEENGSDQEEDAEENGSAENGEEAPANE
ncbi:two-component system regulatory protein YycI [Marinococcus luteus]|uniref:two-component system regulatory protein YycI n=1 Tax=Marinococcus luteus TaxID=1122204 RepID=UPI002ACD0FB6|nr:two-component system regulatory protein YycI [Marinococcus luteus]MDZ5782537.1 two-component system regulatory protein YycI [Marinococcus luteus]